MSRTTPRLKPTIDHVASWYRAIPRAYVDLAAIAATVIPLYFVLLRIDAFDLAFHWSREHESWELDELFALGFCLGLAAMVFGGRRVGDLRREIAQRKEAEREAHRLARHDVLTGLPNRRLFLEAFPKWMSARSRDSVCALMVLDLDHFKPINDLYGHRLGDEVLRAIAARLSTIVGNDGLVARLGGDEFGILMPVSRDQDAQVRLAWRIAHEIPKPIILASLVLEVGVSIGIAVDDREVCTNWEMALRDGSEVETLLRQADMAMYRAKTEGRGSYRFFDSEMDDRLHQRVQLEREIKSAIANGEIVPYYQPIVELAGQRPIGYEILARWHHPREGLLSPAVFIPIAEAPAPSAS